MATSPPGSASAPKSDVMRDLEVRSPVPPTKSTSDLVEQVLAHVRSAQPDDPSQAPAPPPLLFANTPIRPYNPQQPWAA